MKIGNQTMNFGQLILTVMQEKRHGTQRFLEVPGKFCDVCSSKDIGQSLFQVKLFKRK